jgi:hypothetical protein
MPNEIQQNAATQGGAASAPSPEEDFDTALAALISDQSDPASAAADSQDGAGETGAAAEPAPSHDAATVPAAADPAPANTSTDDTDIWSKADPALREAHDKALRDATLRLEGIKGRQSAADKEIKRLREQLAGLNAQGNQGASQASQGQAGNNGSEPLSTDDLQQLREDFPEVAGPLLDKIEALSVKLTAIEAPVGQIQQERTAAFYQGQETLLTQKHSDWQAVVADDRFMGWVEGQPQAIKEALQRNFDAIVDAQEAALVIGQFKAEVGFGSPSAPKPGTQVQERRERQIAAGRDASQSGPPVTTGIPDDLDAAIAIYSRKYG